MENKFAKRITQLRKQNGWSQKLTAQKLGVSQALLSHYEKGIRECSLDFVIKAANVFNVSADYLLGLTVQKSIKADDMLLDNIGEDINPYPVLRNGRAQIYNTMNILYSIAARLGNPKLHTDINNIANSYVYHIFRVLESALPCDDDGLFAQSAERGIIFARSYESLLCGHLLNRINKEETDVRINREYIEREYPASCKYLINMIQKIESQEFKRKNKSV